MAAFGMTDAAAPDLFLIALAALIALFVVIVAMQPSELGEPAAIGPKRILEIKQSADTSSPDWLAEILADLPEGDAEQARPPARRTAPPESPPSR